MESTTVTGTTPRSPFRRPGCWIGLIICALIPCFCVTLASQGEIRIPLGGVPEYEIRLWLVMDAQQRGIGISTASLSQPSDTAACVQTQVSYLLWVGSGASSVYCSCYDRNSANSQWSLTTQASGVCTAPSAPQ